MPAGVELIALEVLGKLLVANDLRTGRDEAIVVTRVISVVVGDGDDLDWLVGDRPDLRDQAIVVGLPRQLRVYQDNSRRCHTNNRVRAAARYHVQPWLDRLDRLYGLATASSRSRGLSRRQRQREEG